MPDLVNLQSALTELRPAIDTIEEDFGRSALRIAADLMRQELASDLTTVNTARVNDLAFVLGDIRATAAELTGSDAERIAPLVARLSSEMSALEDATALPAELLAQIEALMSKLSARRSATQRQTYAEGAPAPLPHPPAELRTDAEPVRERLAAAGFATPSLDALIADPSSLTFQSMSDIIDELEVVAGV